MATEKADQQSSWSWDASLYAGSAPYYAAGRVPYPDELATVLAEALRLDGAGRLLDIGCGPGTLTLLLAPHFAEVYGVDADADMLAEGARLAEAGQIGHISWRHLRAEELPADLPPPDVVTLAQSFHWMDRERVARTVHRMLADGGVLVHVSAETDHGLDDAVGLPHPRPPWTAIRALVRRYLGEERRAGQGVLPRGLPGDENSVYRGAGFVGPERLEVAGRMVTRTTDDVVASVHSLSSAAPHLFGHRLDEFDAELREVLTEATPAGMFSEQMGPVSLDLWRP